MRYLILLLVLLFCYLIPPAAADRDCDWHAANDAPPDYAHYDAVHDYDGDGIGCDTITGEAQIKPVTQEELDAIVEAVAEELETQPDDETAAVPSVPSVALRANSNFRSGPGLAFVTVGGGATGSVYEWTAAQYGAGGYIWYKLVLPAGAGWVRGDLVDLLNAGNIPESTPIPTDSL